MNLRRRMNLLEEKLNVLNGEDDLKVFFIGKNQRLQTIEECEQELSRLKYSNTLMIIDDWMELR